MEIEDCGELTKFETMPREGTLYLSALLYPPNSWMAGPGAMEKSEVIRMLGYYSGITKARIYSVKVPLEAIGA